MEQVPEMRPTIRQSTFAAVALLIAALPSAAAAQLLSERVDGLTRICIYPGTANVVSDGPTRTLRVGIGQNCPFNHPGDSSGQFPAPPTAQLRETTVTDNVRRCVYEQAGTSWAILIEPTQSCPLYAGMAAQVPGSQAVIDPRNRPASQ
jgi:hypothetical protein